MVPSLAFVGGLVVVSRRSKFHVADPTLVSTLYVSEWSNFYIVYIEGEEETKAEPDPNPNARATFGVP